MNKIYKVIWNAALQCWVAVSELGKAKGKTKSKKVLSAAALATLVSTAIVGNVKAAIEAGSGAGLAIQSQKTSAQYGAFAKADAATSTAIGYLVVAESNHALAIGSQTQAIGEKTVAIGHLSRATGTESTALGVNATAKGNGDIALGKHAVAQGGADGVTGSAALGDEAKATGAQSAAVGGKSNASGSHAVASGYNTQATGGSSSAIGDAAEASGNQATAVGVSSVAGGTASSAFGGGAKATGYYSLAAGTQANATHSGSTAVGGEAQATNEKTTAVGSSSKASESWATATGASANASGEASAAFGESATASGKKSIATGSHASASGENAIASGKNAKALASNTTAIGADANATSNAVNSTVIGRGAVVNATDATVIGPVAQAHGANATAIGRGAAANGTESTALGRGSVANGNQSTALGKGSSVTVDSGVALGDGAVANRVALDKNTIQINTQNLAATTGLSDNNNGGDANTVYAPVKLVDAPGALEAIQNTVMGNKGAVSVGDANNTRQIINVAPGSADSDAVNVAQLKAVAGAIKKYSVTSPDGSITITDLATGDDPQNFQIQMNTTAVRNAAAWKIKDNGKADSTAAEVKGGDVVDFRGTNSVKVERSGRDLTFSANTASIIGNSDGSVKSRASDAYSTTNTAPADWLVTSINVADAINKSGWQLQANGSRVGLVNPGDKVNFEAGNGVTITPTNESNGVSKLNIAAKVDNSTISYNSKGELQANTNYGWSIKTANTTAVAVPNGQAVSLNEGQYINITHNGRDLQFNAKTADVGMNTTTGATNQATATGLATNKAVADAIQASGFQLKENGTLKNVVNPGESLNFKSGQGTTVSVGTNGDVQVNANVADIKAGNNVTVTNNSGVYTINANDTNTQVTVTNATSSPITIATTQNTNGTSHYTVDVNVDGTTIKKENGVLKAIIPAVETVTLNVNTTGNNAGKVDAPKDADKGKLVTAENVAKAINESFWIAKKGTRVETNNDNATTAESNIAAGNNVTFIAGKNIALEKKGNAFIYATKDDVSFNNVTANNSVTNNLTVNPNNTAGSTFKVGGNTTVDMGGNQIHNVSNGTAPTDAVNLSQLNASAAAAKTEVKAGKNVSSVNESKDAKDGHTIYTIDTVDNSAHVQAAANNAAVKVEKATATRADGNTTVTDYTVDLTDATKTNITHGVNANETVTNKGLTFNGNTGSTGAKKLGSTVDVKGGDKVITTNATTAGITINYNGTEAAKVTNLTYKANGANAQSVNLTTGLDFTNGTQTTAEVAANGVVKFNVNTTALSNVTNNGKITVPEGNGLVTAKEVAEAINASYWKANAGGNVDGATVTDNVTTGTEVFFAAGKNLKVKHSANNFTFSTADDVSFNNVTTNNLTVKNGGNVDMGGNQVHNVANGTKGTDAVNLDQLNATTATAKTEVKAGKNVSSVNESKDAKDGHTVYTIDAVDTSAHVKAAESNAAVKVEKAATTRADGNTTVTDYTVDLTDETKANITHGVNANTTVTTKGLTFNGNEGTTGIKKLGSKVDVKGGTANNVITTNATEAGITINYNGTEAAKVTHLTYKANGANAQSVNLTTGLDFTNGTQTTAEVAANGVVKFNVNTTALSNVTNNGKITVPEGNGLVTAKEVAEAINASYWKANAGGNVDGATVTDNVTTGTEVFFAAGKNLKVKHSANNFTFSTADDVSFNNVTTNNLTVKNGGNVDMGGNQVHNVANGTKGTDAVNLDQLNATTATANAGWVIKANGTNATTVKPNATVSLNNTDGNILITKNKTDNNVTFNFNPNATFGVVGKDGKDGVDGSIGVNGKDGASVVINGKDGSIGLTGPKGADGKDGVSVTLKPEKGTTTVNAKDDGKEIERIKYTANGTTREVATLDDGLKFKGDSKQVINRTLGSQMNITGGADETTLTDNNIGVVYDKATDGLKVKLAKDVNLTSNGSVTIGNTTLNNNGFTITNKADPSKTVSVTDKGLNNGGNTIINVAPGVNGTDAVNLDQLNATTAIANAGWVIKANGTNATTVKPNATVSLNNTDGNILITKNKTDNNVTFNFNPNATFGVVGKDGKDGVDGSIGVNGKDGSSVVINGKDGSIGLNGKDGKNGLSIKGDQGPAGVDGKDGETKTRIVYEYADPKDPNKTIRENVATLNDGLRFTGNNGVENAHRLNTLVTIVGEGVDKAASANFTSASGNINVKADGKGTLEVQLAKNLKNIETINNGNSTITLNKDGGTTISGGDVSVDGNKVTNVKDGDVSANSKDAVNGSQLYHVMTNATAGWNLSVNNGKDKGNVKPGAQVDLNNTDGNIIISKTANNVTFNFNPNATFGVKGKDGKDGVDGSIGVNGKDGASVVINGKDGSIGLTGPKGADGKDGASANMSVQKGTTTVNTDRDGGKDVTRIVYTDKDKDGKDIKREVATLDDGLKFKGDSEQVINRTLGSQMNITGGADSTKLTDNNIGVVYDEATNGLKVKLSKDVDLGKDGSITIGGTQVTNNGLTIKNGPSVTEKGVDAGNKKVTNVADGDINATSKDAVNGSQLYQAVNNINKNVNAAKTELEEGDNVTITSRVGNNGQTIYKVSSTDNSAHVQGGSDAVSVTKAETTRKDGSTTVTDYTVDLSSKTKDDIKKGVDAHDTVTNKGLTFNADKGTTGAKKLGSQVAVNGDNKNIETVADTNGVKVKLKDDINVNSVTANTFKAGDTIVNTKGVQVAAKDDRGNNTNVVINEKGINAGNTRIQNVAAGRADTDAVNVSQLKGAVTQIGNHINKMDKNLRAGIAGAMAAGGLYHATLPGKSMVAAGAGTYKGESAVAVGYSRLSDNGKVGIKFSVNTNTRGDSGAAASVGYQW